MRFREIKTILKKNEPAITIQNINAGNFQQIENYEDIVTILSVVNEIKENKNWRNAFEELKVSQNKMVKNETFNILNEEVGYYNASYNHIYSFLEKHFNDENEYDLNLKLPVESIDLKELNSILKLLEDFTKSIDISDDVKFEGIDKGSDWINLIVIGEIPSYILIMTVLRIAQEIFKTKTEYFKSKEAKYHYTMAKKKDENCTQKDYETDYIKVLIDEQIIEYLKNNAEFLKGREDKEFKINLNKAIENILKLLEKNVEIHPSSNTPNYLDKENLTINYEELKKLQSKEEEIAQIENKFSDDDDKEEETKDEE